MSQEFQAGDFLIFQIESGFGLLRVLSVDPDGPVWHLKVYRDLYPEIEFAELALGAPDSLGVELPHIALTDRAFESTQVSRLGNKAVTDEELAVVNRWRNDPAREVSDRSIRLTLGLR